MLPSPAASATVGVSLSKNHFHTSISRRNFEESLRVSRSAALCWTMDRESTKSMLLSSFRDISTFAGSGRSGVLKKPSMTLKAVVTVTAPIPPVADPVAIAVVMAKGTPPRKGTPAVMSKNANPPRKVKSLISRRLLKNPWRETVRSRRAPANVENQPARPCAPPAAAAAR